MKIFDFQVKATRMGIPPEPVTGRADWMEARS
jgi:hypothetical protein